MNKSLLSALLATLLSTASWAGTASSKSMTPANPLANEIDVAEWSLKHSSVAATISAQTLENSLQLLSRAREELARGHEKTAQELSRQASQPITRMEGQALKGKHPDQVLHIDTIRQTLVSITDAGENIAREKAASTAFVTAARDALQRSDALLAAQNIDAARALLLQSYAQVQQHVSQLRSGDYFYIEARAGAVRGGEADWADGLRRMDERRVITGYLLLEAQVGGIDVSEMQQGVSEAEAAFDQAERQAKEERWEQALKTLDFAYARYEDSWRAVGVEW